MDSGHDVALPERNGTFLEEWRMLYIIEPMVKKYYNKSCRKQTFVGEDTCFMILSKHNMKSNKVLHAV